MSKLLFSCYDKRAVLIRDMVVMIAGRTVTYVTHLTFWAYAPFPGPVSRCYGEGDRCLGPPRLFQGASVRPTRKPRSLYRTSVVSLPRLAERRRCGSLTQEPPRTTRRPQSPSVRAEPSAGEPS